MIADERVRLFCVAAQVVDVEKKIDLAVAECMRLGTHAIRTSMMPLPLTGMVSTPTISRVICEHVLLCFGFPKTVPAEVDEVMTRIVLGNLKQYLAISITQFIVLAAASSGLALATAGAGAVAWLAIPLLHAPTTARMVLKCSMEMILIMERSFRYGGKYVTVKQIENAALEYVSTKSRSTKGSSEKLQDHVRREVDRLVPLKRIVIGFRFNRLRTNLEQLIYSNRIDMPPDYEELDPSTGLNVMANENTNDQPDLVNTVGDVLALVELDAIPEEKVAELPGLEVQASPHDTFVELPGSEIRTSPHATSVELPATDFTIVRGNQTIVERVESGKSSASGAFSTEPGVDGEEPESRSSWSSDRNRRPSTNPRRSSSASSLFSEITGSFKRITSRKGA
jgi:hypothetical protein